MRASLAPRCVWSQTPDLRAVSGKCGRFVRGMTHLEIRAECGMAVAWSELASIKRPVVARVNPNVRGATGRGLPLNRRASSRTLRQ
jgi:hypothetical protein